MTPETAQPSRRKRVLFRVALICVSTLLTLALIDVTLHCRAGGPAGADIFIWITAAVGEEFPVSKHSSS